LTYLSAIEIEPGEGMVRLVKSVLTEAMAAEIDRAQGFYTIDGMSGYRYRWFINTLVRRMAQPAYLEVGSWQGSTLCAAIAGNAVRALAIDNWSEFGGPKDQFLANVGRYRGEGATVGFFEGDFRAVPFAAIAEHVAPFNIYLFDGPHEEADQYDGLVRALPALAERFVFICDDWNWARVRAGTHRAIAESGLDLLFGAEVRTTLDGSNGVPGFKESDWHNGYFIGVLSKR